MLLSAACRTFALILVFSVSSSVSYSQPALTPGSGRYQLYQQDKAVGVGDYTVQAM